MTKGDAGDRAMDREVKEAWADYFSRAEAREDRDPLAIFRSLRPEDVETFKRPLGALERRAIKFRGQRRFLTPALSDGLALFYRHYEITAVLRRFEELGLADLLNPPPEPEYEDDPIFGQVPKLKWEKVDRSARICAAVGAKAASIETFRDDDPLLWREFGEREAEAWFLTNFAFFYSRQSAPYASIDERLKWALALGGLLQWGEFWFEGHDANAQSAQIQRTGGKVGGQQPKRRVWAEELAENLIARGARDLGSARALIPDANQQAGEILEINDDAGFYFSQNKLIFIDPVTGKELDSMTWENFVRRYFRRTLSQDGQ
jgi:hypothetical protein